MKKDKKLIKYEDTWLTFYNYKEPLVKIPKSEGRGYYGCLLGTIDGSGVQCHVCGKVFESLVFHINKTHRMNCDEYKVKFKLAGGTALVCEKLRNRFKERTLKWLASLSEEEKEAYKKMAREQMRKWKEKTNLKELSKLMSHPLRLETKNKRGTCPDQLLQKIKEVEMKLGYTPSKFEFINETGTARYVHLIYKTFGSWKNAVKMAGLDLKNLEHKNRKYKIYSKDELLEYLRIFAQEFNKVPTYTDFRRGLLPTYDCYIRRWGSIENAREESGLYDFLTK